MYYLLDDKKVYIIVGITFLFCLFIYLLPNKQQKITTIIPITTKGIIGFEPRYFNKEIYSIPNGKGDPYMLYGTQYPNYATMPIKPGFERLLPIVENLPKTGNIQGYLVQ
jgi:hypothetical protein